MEEDPTQVGSIGDTVSKWADKYVIGLTGNIATGKSIVRKMLERLGAFGLDADALSHRAISKDAPGYLPIVNYFGRWIVGPDGQIDRERLGKIVFNDPVALQQLESIVHPLVFQAVDIIIKRATQPVVVVEAVKLLETEMHTQVNSVWAVTSPRDTQIARLVNLRKMGREEAEQRINAQTTQAEKVSQANVIITNNGSFEDTWKQVYEAWKKIALPTSVMTEPVVSLPKGRLVARRGTPRDYDQILSLVNRLDTNTDKHSKSEFLQTLNDNAFILLQVENKLVGIAGWQVENLICRTKDIYIDPALPNSETIPVLIGEVEKSARDHQCEASLIFLPPAMARQAELWRGMGYENRTPQSLEVQAWQEAALESMPFGTLMFFKQLRQDRVLRPI
jgi:dephospho-CoA kinase